MNACHLCYDCPMEKTKAEEYQEIHVTVNGTDETLQYFKQACEDYGGKVITIELGGWRGKEYQTMSSVSIKGTRAQAFRVANVLGRLAIRGGAFVERVKLESSIFHSDFVGEDGYFEGHFAVECTAVEHTALRKVASILDAHGSKNAFKENVYMVTYRITCAKADFLLHMDHIETTLNNRWKVLKRIHEFCYYDSNESLDKNWIDRVI